MKLSKLEEQGVRLAVCLARRGGQMTLPELSEEEQLSEALVAKIMGKLRRGGVVCASRGRTGGYELARSPDSLTVAAVIRSLGRPLFEGCSSSRPLTSSSEVPCPHVSDCCLRPIWEHLASKMTEVLDQITLSELVTKERHVRARMVGLGSA